MSAYQKLRDEVTAFGEKKTREMLMLQVRAGLRPFITGIERDCAKLFGVNEVELLLETAAERAASFVRIADWCAARGDEESAAIVRKKAAWWSSVAERFEACALEIHAQALEAQVAQILAHLEKYAHEMTDDSRMIWIEVGMDKEKRAEGLRARMLEAAE